MYFNKKEELKRRSIVDFHSIDYLSAKIEKFSKMYMNLYTCKTYNLEKYEELVDEKQYNQYL